jgi:hypothetical protein
MKKLPIILAMAMSACADTASAFTPLPVYPQSSQQAYDNSMLIRQQNYFQQRILQQQAESIRLQQQTNDRQDREYWENRLYQAIPMNNYYNHRGDQ